MPNLLEFAKIFQTELDQQVVWESTTGWMELNNEFIKYNGGDEAKIPNMVMDGLADYDRENGYVRGSVTLSWDTYKLTQDRGREFLLDSMDVDETNFIATMSRVMSEFQRQQVIPEIDAYRYSKLHAIASEAGQVQGQDLSTGDDVLTALVDAITAIEEETNISNGLVITMSPTLATLLSNAEKAKNFLGKGSLQKGEYFQRVETFNDNAIQRAPQSRLATEFEFLTGENGQEAGGFRKADTAEDINFIISTRTAPIAVSKQDKMRIFDPNTYQGADAWKSDYRKYHELWVPKSKKMQLFVSTKTTAGTGE